LNRVDYTSQVLKYFAIREPDATNPTLGKKLGSYGIPSKPFRCQVLPTVKFQGQVSRGTEEVQNVRVNGMLPSELQS